MPDYPKYMHGQQLKSAGIDPNIMIDTLVPDVPSSSFATLQTAKSVHQKITEEEQMQMLMEAAASGSTSLVEDKFGVSRGYLRMAMKRKFGSIEAYKEVLRGLVLENAVAIQMIAQEKLPQLTAPQAIFGGKLLVDTLEKVEKSIQNTPKTVNFAQLEKVGETLKSLRSIVDKASELKSDGATTGNGG